MYIASKYYGQIHERVHSFTLFSDLRPHFSFKINQEIYNEKYLYLTYYQIHLIGSVPCVL